MTPDRLDDLLARALEAGTVPADATAEERVELEPLLARARELRLNAARVSAEASEAMPTARARFQRHLGEQRAPAAAPAETPPAQRGFLGRLLAGRAMTLATTAAAIGVIAVVAVLVLQPFSSVETASALTIDDYVQVQGVVSASGDGSVTVQAPNLGNLEVALSELTAVTDSAGVRQADSLRPGDPVLVSGVVTAKRAIAASNVAVAERQNVPAEATPAKIPVLKNFRQGLQGSVSLIALSPDGSRARVLLVTAGERFLIDVDPRSMNQFLASPSGTVGARVRVVDAPDLPKGVFRLQPIDSPPSPTPIGTKPGLPEFQNIRGVVLSREVNVFTIQTDRGRVPVVIRPGTTIRLGDSGLTLESILAGETAIGYEVAVSGNLDPSTGRRIMASLVVVIGKASIRPSGE